MPGQLGVDRSIQEVILHADEKIVHKRFIGRQQMEGTSTYCTVLYPQESHWVGGGNGVDR
jgi:serine/threonine protein phosphatase PrpC